MNQSISTISLIILILLVITSCASRKNIVYIQGEGDNVKSNVDSYQPTIQNGDILIINVSSLTPAAALPFNLYEVEENGNREPIPYIVNADGAINFPVIGEFKVAGITTKEMIDQLNVKLEPYLKDPIVNVRITNFKVTVLGEVKNPGAYTVLNERINILEAIGLAGDLTIQGKRDPVKLIREKDGVREVISLDLTDKDLFNSPYYYLSQNDIIYVEPNKARVNSSAVGSNTSVILTSVSVLISVAALILR